MEIGGIQKLSTIDYPKQISCVIFTCGCNLSCEYCHNKQLIHMSTGIIREEDILEFLKERRKILDAVVISGGEPTLQKDLKEFTRKIKALGYLIKLDTNGTNMDLVDELINEKLIDYIAIDLKYKPCVIVENTNIEYELRTGENCDGIPNIKVYDRRDFNSTGV